jgi:capsule polysaccharide export protein KpsE/RkpR
MSDDIVTRLRAVLHNDRGVELMNREAADEIERLTDEVSDLKKRISDASAIMCDWDGFFDPKTQSGNTVELAKLIEEAYRILNSKESDK